MVRTTGKVYVLEGAPEEGVLVEELAGAGGLHVPAAELDAVALEEAELLLGEDERAVLGSLLEAEQTLETGLEVIPSPDAADPGDTDVDALKSELIGHTLGAVRGMVKRVGEDLGLELLGDAVRMGPPRPAALFDQGGDATDLEGPADLVEGFPVVAHDAAGLGDVLELLRQLQQRQLPSSTLSDGGHSSTSWVLGCLSNSQFTQKAGWSPLSSSWTDRD
jgi:hypothetical protein